MDPNANLDEQRRIADRIYEDERSTADAIRLADLATALDLWIKLGGMYPVDWLRPNVTLP